MKLVLYKIKEMTGVKSMFKRMLSLLLVLVMVGSMLPTVFAQEAEEPTGSEMAPLAYSRLSVKVVFPASTWARIPILIIFM